MKLVEYWSVLLTLQAVFVGASEAFSKKNIDCTIDESLRRYTEVTQAAKEHKIRIRGYLSVFVC